MALALPLSRVVKLRMVLIKLVFIPKIIASLYIVYSILPLQNTVYNDVVQE